MRWVMLLLMVFFLSLTGLASAVDESENDTVDLAASGVVAEEAWTYIFIQEGKGGTFVKDETGNYTLTITGAVPYTVYFSDRPARDAGMVEMERFLEGFNFDPNNPPNALLTIREGEEERDMIVVELTEPGYDNATDTLTYKAKVIADYEFESDWPEDLFPRADMAIPEQFGEVVLIIDDCPCILTPDFCPKTWWTNTCWHCYSGLCACGHCDGCC